jgi:hypothetical protein
MTAWDFESDVETPKDYVEISAGYIAEFELEPASIVDLRRFGLGYRSGGERVTATRTSLCSIEVRGSNRLRVACLSGLSLCLGTLMSGHFGV